MPTFTEKKKKIVFENKKQSHITFQCFTTLLKFTCNHPVIPDYMHMKHTVGQYQLHFYNTKGIWKSKGSEIQGHVEVFENDVIYLFIFCIEVSPLG